MKALLLLPLWVVGWLMILPYYIAGKLASPFVVYYALKKYGIQPEGGSEWRELGAGNFVDLFDCKREYVSGHTGAWWDSWYMDKPAAKFWRFGPFWAEWYWRVRNGFSNGMRYPLMMRGTPADRVVKLPGYHEGFYKGPKHWAYGTQDYSVLETKSNWLVRIEYDKGRPWVARITITYLVNEFSDVYYLFYCGYKLDRKYPEFGFSLRPFFFWPFRNEDRY